MKGYKRLFFCAVFFCGAVALGGCDLQPKIASIPDSIGEFISERYPALLADPVTESEIYNSAVTDYGVYASPELYGAYEDYLVYADIDDYVFDSRYEENTKPEKEQEVPNKTVQSADSNQNKRNQEAVNQSDQETNDYLIVPDYVKSEENIIENKIAEKADSDSVIVVRGDTLYSIAKKYNTSVSELAEINSLKEPYTLSIGQKLKLHPDVSEKQKIEKDIQPVKVVPVQDAKPVQTSTVSATLTAQKTTENAKKTVNTEQKQQSKIITQKTDKKDLKSTPTKNASVKRVAVQEITVAPGDTLYSLSRKYEIPLNDLAVMNKITSPFTLSVGQKLKVPKFEAAKSQTVKSTDKKIVKTQNKNEKIEPAKSKKGAEKKNSVPAKETRTTKTSSDSKKQQVQKISARSSTKFSWPIRGKILSQYGAKNGGLFNDGINISANMGAAVKAAENGVVAYAGNEVKGMGNLIIIQHSDGWMTVYAHLDSMSVRRGSKVTVGQQIGKIGKTGKVDKPQVHFELRKGTKAYNPIPYLKK